MGSAIGGGAEAVAGGKTRGKDAVLSKFTVVFALSLRCSASYLEIYEYFLIVKGGLPKLQAFFLFTGKYSGG